MLICTYLGVVQTVSYNDSLMTTKHEHFFKKLNFISSYILHYSGIFRGDMVCKFLHILVFYRKGTQQTSWTSELNRPLTGKTRRLNKREMKQRRREGKLH